MSLRRYADASVSTSAQSSLLPKMPTLRASRAEVELDWHADPRPLISTIRGHLAKIRSDAKNVAQIGFADRYASAISKFAARTRRAADDGCYEERYSDFAGLV